MIKIENTEVMGFEAAIRGMRNPMNSLTKSDSYFDSEDYILGDDDLKLASKLAKAGSDHAKFRRMIVVSMDITAPLYFWKEFDTYKVGTVSNSCSTMHKIHDKEFTIEDFSVEQLYAVDNRNVYRLVPLDLMSNIVAVLNDAREVYLRTGLKEDWWQMIQLLPSSYNQRRTIMLNYEVLANQYHARKGHKLDEWREYCEWVETLPYSKELIILGGINNEREVGD